MLKRTNGYILLTLLVITGLASQVTNKTLTGKERKQLTEELKDTRSAFLQSIKGLSENQMNYKPAADKWSVREIVLHIALSEQALGSWVTETMKQPVNGEKRSEIKVTDEDVSHMLRDRSKKFTARESLLPEKSPWTTTEEAVEATKAKRAELIRYVKTTTHDMRNHVVQLPFGHGDGYHMMLLVAGHMARHTEQIREVKNDPGFPKD